MLVEDFIKELKKMPEGSTIGMIDVYEYRLIKDVYIQTNKDFILNSLDDEVSIEHIEKARISNKEKICDYYITL